MPGVEEQRRVGIRDLPRELLHGLVQGALVGIGRQHDFEAERPQGRGDIVGVVFRVREAEAGILVLGIADHEGDAAVRQRRIGCQGREQHARGQCEGRDKELCHDSTCPLSIVKMEVSVIFVAGRSRAVQTAANY